MKRSPAALIPTELGSTLRSHARTITILHDHGAGPLPYYTPREGIQLKRMRVKFQFGWQFGRVDGAMDVARAGAGLRSALTAHASEVAHLSAPCP